MKSFPTLAPIAVLCACATTPELSPPDTGARIVQLIADQQPTQASALFEDVEDHDGYRERIYPVVYEAARRRHEAGAHQESAEMLRFLSTHYPEAMAVREALLYSLFLDRARRSAPDPMALDELERLLEEVSARPRPPVWTHLIEAQVAIDRNRPEEARASLDRFLLEWDQHPDELVPYVAMVDQYLEFQLEPGGS